MASSRASLAHNYIEWVHVEDTLERLGDVSCSIYCLMMRAGRIITTPPMVGIMDFHDPYMQWYHHITRHFMTPPLHRDDMGFHTTTNTIQILVS